MTPLGIAGDVQKNRKYHGGPNQALLLVTAEGLDELKARMGWRDAAFRAAVRAGLKIYRSGKRIYVLGTDVVVFVTRAKDGDR